MDLKSVRDGAIALGKENFQLAAGCDELPGQFATMLKYAPGAFAGYALMRAELMREKGEGGALDLKTKSLIFILLCIMSDDIAHAKIHLDNAVKGGLTMPEFAESLTQVLMVGGVSRWNNGCAELIEEAARLITERDEKND